MYLFLLTFFLLYGGMHLYAFLKAKAAFAFDAKAGTFIALFMLIMVLAPLIVRLSEKQGFELFARLMSYIGYTWMGVLFIFFSSAAVIDIYRILIYFGEIISQKGMQNLKPSAMFSFLIPLLLSVSIAIYGYFETLNIRTERVTINTAKIPKDAGRLRIVQISDVHIGLIVREERLKRILEIIKKENPDILISTGDLVDGQIDSLSGLSGLFKEINPEHGKFAITGNHEFYAGLSQALSFTGEAGFKILRGEGLTVAGINIVGVDDPAGKQYGLYKEVSEKEFLSRFLNGKFTLFLKHRPVIEKNVTGIFDLQLSGHAHKGQIFPFSLLTRLYYRHTAHAGHLKLINDSYLYVSRGTGTWGPPIRFLAPPEVTVIELVSSN